MSPSAELRNICMDFGENRVLDDVSVAFRSGEIHAVLGANGSGKSTLIKILAGYHGPTGGTLLLRGRELATPVTQRELDEAGVRFIHQDLGLYDTLSVADNLALTLGYETRGGISWSAQHDACARDLAAVGLDDVDPRALVGTLGPVQRTLVAMARALRDLPEGGLLVLDEPTARLPHDQVDALLERCRALRDRGVALVYVSHRLDEVFAMADVVTVLRDGRVALSGPLAEMTEAELTMQITGHAERASLAKGPGRAVSLRRSNEIVASVEQLSGVRLENVSIDIAAGEILAITGLIGSGRSELGRILFGAQQPLAGHIRVGNRDISGHRPRDSVALGVGYVPQDRAQGGFRRFDLIENLDIADLRSSIRRGLLSPSRRRRAAERDIRALSVHPADPTRLLGELSGGNQQKVIIGKWLRLPLRLLILDEPTYGVDVGARESIMALVTERAEQGLAVLLLDSDIDLVAAYAHRVLVMQRGRIVSELRGDDLTPERIAAACYAVAPSTTIRKATS